MTELQRLEPTIEVLDLRNPTTDSWTDVLEQVGDLSARIARTDFVPEAFRGNVAAVAATILYGREVGLGPMQSLASLHNIKGKVGMYAETMRALVLQAGHEIVVVESSSARVTVKGRRRGSDEWSQVTWTIDDARQAKLGGSSWTAYPRQMLAARATAELCRLIFPDAIHGLMAVEELEAGDDTTPIPTTTPSAPAGSNRTTVQRRRKPPETTPTPPPPPPEDPPLPDTPPPAPEPQEPTQPPLADEPDPEPEPAKPPTQPPANISPQQRALLMAKFTELNITDRDERLHIQAALAGRHLTTSNDLTRDQASHIIDALAGVRDRTDLDNLLTITGQPR